MVENGDMYTNLPFGIDTGSISEGDGHDDEHNDGELLREQDRFLPIANVARIMKRSVPKTGKIAKEAKDCLQECVSEFVSFITSEASERCHQEKRKTINGEDLLYAMSQLGFDNYIEPLKIYLQKYRDATKNDKCFIQTINMEGTGEELSGEESFLALTEQNGESALLYGTNYTIAPTQF